MYVRMLRMSMYVYIHLCIYFSPPLFPFSLSQKPTVARHVTGMLSKRRSNVTVASAPKRSSPTTVEAGGAVTAITAVWGGALACVLDGRENREVNQNRGLVSRNFPGSPKTWGSII